MIPIPFPMAGRVAMVATGDRPMTNVIPFPIRRRAIRQADPPAPRALPMDKIVAVIWAITVFLWTFMRFIVPLIVFWQFLRMCWFWNTPGRHEGLWFAAYFIGYSAIKYFVAFYRPKGWTDPTAVRGRGGRNVR